MLKLKPLLISTVLFTLSAGQSFAADADNARAHFQAIAAGNMAEIMAHYADNAHLEWVGGPLDGAYNSSDAIQQVWSKFSTAQGNLQYTVNNLTEASNPKGSTVSAQVHFNGKNALNVSYILTYRAGKIVSEIWQVTPNPAK
ncbi:nuclear transport factor 2 family protein [Pantoea sp. Al-1710]|jgi:ketosteroid isomerase-like protein|uniref:Nuclear transport factor 2 family protein n=1 Tax=Candidatus Pantoea communis TaxID=2608354 RepID=A0ABX0RNS2_9GAMM|nr:MULTISPECIES: nuclear transport factor 2 family protein [Enterobacterales]NIG19266.1 nuclear transport factor 2 family protein [Pantoea communis]